MQRSGSDAARLENAPKPPAFLDPLCHIEDCYFYSVPTFYEANHPTTNWLLNRILSNDVELLRRKLEVSPGMFSGRYFQVLDDPAVYQGKRMLSGPPMFHPKCLLYLTPLGVCLYFKSLGAASLFLTFRNTTGQPLASPEEAQFASHLMDTTDGDFHAFTPFVIMMRRQFFATSTLLQQNGWRPDRPFALPLRRRYERRVMYCRDWLDAALGLLACRPIYPIAALVLSVTANPLYRYSRLPIAAVKPPPDDVRPASAKRGKAAAKLGTPAAKGGAAAAAAPAGKKRGSGDVGDPWSDPTMCMRSGILPFGDQPLDVPLVGTRNLLQLCEVYNRSVQSRANSLEIEALLRQARADGVNTNILLMQAEENIAPDPKPDGSDEERNANNAAIDLQAEEQLISCQSQPLPPPRQRRLMWRLNCNNHAKKDRRPPTAPQLAIEERPHCSEPLRILLFSLTKDKSCSSLTQCLEAVGTYVRRYYFSCAQELPAEHGRSRDTRNVVVCLLNMISREQLAMDAIVARIRSGCKRWRALEMHKQQHSQVISKISGLMTSVLISSKQIVSFLAVQSFPPYSEKAVDFDLHSKMAPIFTSVRYGVVRDLNNCKDSWKYLTHDMLAKVVRDSAVTLHLKCGKRPTKAQMEEYSQMLDRLLFASKGKK